MIPLARLWTWTGQVFIPLAFAWAVYVRNGLDTAPPSDGVIISRAYAGLLMTLAAGMVLGWSFALYVAAAKQRRAKLLVPPNTTFEDKKDRNAIVSWATATVFAAAIIAELIVFGSSYAKSEIHDWESTTPLQRGFWSSRAAAHRESCEKQPCFALGARLDASRHPIYGVYEYIPYITDGAVLLLALGLFAGLVRLVSAPRKQAGT